MAEEVRVPLTGHCVHLTLEQKPKKKVSEQFAFLPAILVESRESVE